VIEYRYADGHFERLPELADELVRLPANVIVAEVTAASLAAKKATSTTPIVMYGPADRVGAGLVTSLARPGGNVTGTSSIFDQLVGKALELLRDTGLTFIVWRCCGTPPTRYSKPACWS
jgi:putative ABC transport system substrate-binding protein